ncbi:MAG: hypothetical protein O2888_01760 [Chloroflexi bacterium]|nr:hypothetical protein [Chloroflexota bacterium]
MGAGAVLVVVLAIVVVGLVFAWYLPPRAHVLTVGDLEFSARDVADRAHYLASVGNEAVLQDPAGESLESIVREQLLLQAGPGLVGEVTDEEVRDSVAESFGLGEEYTDDLLNPQVDAYLEATPITRARIMDLVRAGIVEERLVEQFEAAVPESGDQLHLIAARTTSLGTAQQLVERVRSGEDFTEVAVEMELAEAEQGQTVIGWFAPETLPERLAPVADLSEGGVSDPIEAADRIWFDVFFVSERTSTEPYAEGVRTQIASRAFTYWMDEQEATMRIERNLTSSHADWIRRQLQAALRG